MMSPISPAHRWTIAIVTLSTFACCSRTWGQDQSQLSKPVYRVANDAAVQPAAQPTQVPVAVTQPSVVAQPGAAIQPSTPQPEAATRSPFDLTRQGQEHPLAPCVRTFKSCQEYIDQNVRDYSCTLVKQERVEGELGEVQNIAMKVRNEPFSVYMRFLKPFQGREVLYVNGQNNNEMFVLEAGWKRTVLGNN